MITLQEIVQKQRADDCKFRVNVCITCHNQAPFIKDALDSILMQKTTFLYQIIIGDDCSTDGSVEILKGYEERYEGKIKVIFHSQHVGVNQNRKEMFQACDAPYLTFCDGDDYWCRNDVLEKKYMFLETHPEYMGYTTATKTVKEGKELERNDLVEKNACGIFGKEEALKNSYPGLYGAFFFRNFMKYMDRTDFEMYSGFQVDDSSKMPIVAGIIGDIYRNSDEVTYGYRWVHNSLEHIAQEENRCAKLWDSHMELIKMVEQLFGLSGVKGMQIAGQMETLAVDAFLTACKLSFRVGGKDNWKQFGHIYKDGYLSKMHIGKCVFRRIRKRLMKSNRA